MRVFLVFLAMAAAGVQPALQSRPDKPAPGAVETAHLGITTSAEGAAGSHVSLVTQITPKPKMHVYAPGQNEYIPVTLKVDSTPLFTAAPPKYPEPEKLLLTAVNETVLVYAKPFRITQDVTLTRDARRLQSTDGVLTIKGSLRYQACDDTICYLPKTVPIEWKVSTRP